MMQDLNALWAKDSLDSVQSLWFRTPKPEEELYDLQMDPYELENLANTPELQDTLVHLRQVLNNWIDSTNDLGQYPEKELIAKWLPEGQQPQLPPLELEEKDQGVLLRSAQPDATIVWKQPVDSVWQIYTNPLPVNTSFQAKAERIGYSDSDILEYILER